MEEDGTGTVRTDDGEISCGILDGLKPGSNVVVVVRPESINLHLQKPANSANVYRSQDRRGDVLGRISRLHGRARQKYSANSSALYSRKSAAAIRSGSSCRPVNAWRCPADR